jgi:hypothetical protein
MRTICLFLLLVLPSVAAPSPEAKRVTPPEFGEAKQPQIAITDAGTIHITFGKADAIYATSSDNNGASFSEPVKVGELPKLALGMRRGPRIATAGQMVILAAISHDDGNLYSWWSDDRGRTWSKSNLVNTVAKSAAEGLHGLASDGKAKVAAVWLDLRNGKTELWASVSTDQGKTWPANTQVYRSPDLSICECCHPSIAFTKSGAIVVMWRNWINGNRDMYLTQSSDGGKTFSKAAKLGTSTWKLQACPMDGGSLAVGVDRIAYAWRREGTLLTTTDPAAEAFLSNSGTQPVAVRTKDGFAYLWQDRGNLYWRATATTQPTLFASQAGYATAAWNPKQRNSTVVWEGGDGLYVQPAP